MLLALLMLAAAPAADSTAGRFLPPNSEFYFAPVVAADHEAVVLSTDAVGRESSYAIVRSGSWLREGSAAPGRAAVVHSDFAAAISVTYLRDDSGHYDVLSIARHPSSETYSLYRRARTGERDRALGEDCEVWSTTRIGERDGEGVNHLSCDTADGIQLWSRAVGFRTGYVVAQSRTLSFRRRPVRPEEVRPPRDLLRWSYWRNLAAAGDVAPERRVPDHELRLASRHGANMEGSRIMRRRGAWSYSEDTERAGERRIQIANRVISIGYGAEADGRPVRLEIHRLPPDQVQHGDSPSYVRIEPASSERVIGETCFWSRQGSAGGGIVVTSGEHRDCVTADGLPLRIFSYHRGGGADLIAISLVRRAPPLSAFMPPAEAFNWARWGVR